MNKSAFSCFAWGLYLVSAGSGFLFIPNVFLPLFGLPTTTEVWIRVIGLLVVILGYYYIHCARTNAMPFIQITVPGRIVFAIGLVVLVLLGFSAPGLLLIGIVDTFGAIWTWWALRAEQIGVTTEKRIENPL
jgi:hypothetical protein